MNAFLIKLWLDSKVFSKRRTRITEVLVKECIVEIFMEHEMVYVTPDRGKPVYQVYDFFLSRWFRWKKHPD